MNGMLWHIWPSTKNSSSCNLDIAFDHIKISIQLIVKPYAIGQFSRGVKHDKLLNHSPVDEESSCKREQREKQSVLPGNNIKCSLFLQMESVPVEYEYQGLWTLGWHHTSSIEAFYVFFCSFITSEEAVAIDFNCIGFGCIAVYPWDSKSVLWTQTLHPPRHRHRDE